MPLYLRRKNRLKGEFSQQFPEQSVAFLFLFFFFSLPTPTVLRPSPAPDQKPVWKQVQSRGLAIAAQATRGKKRFSSDGAASSGTQCPSAGATTKVRLGGLPSPARSTPIPTLPLQSVPFINAEV